MTDPLALTASDADISATIVLDAAMNYALAHNGISPLRGIMIENLSAEPLRDLNVELQLSGPVAGRIAEPLRTGVQEVGVGESFPIYGADVPWTFNAGTFAQLDEAITASVSVKVFDTVRALQAEGIMRLLARDEWWSMAAAESLVAFVTPRVRAVQELVGEASDLLAHRTGDPSVEGYQSGADRAMAIAEAIYDAMRAREIRYIDPPPSFEDTGQKIRPPQEVLVDRWGTCLDLATTYAAALEHAGLHPVLVVCDGHAFAGHLRDRQQLPELVLRDPGMILNYVESGLFVPVETTSLRAGWGKSFAEAIADTRGRGYWSSEIGSVNYLIDVAAAHKFVRPLPAVTVENGVRVVEVERATPTAEPLVRRARASSPVEPVARGGERPQRTYPPRVERWRSSLLDLSFRNPLLNMRSGRTSLELHVPRGALGTLEDMLFAGSSISLIPNDQLADIHLARGARTAQDIDPDTLHGMLIDDSVAFAACAEKSYLSRLRGFQRRARTVVEETGANNLFVTLGTLEWADSGRQARAPLFLVPVTLRAHRGRPFTVQIDDGGYAQPNQCLLEKLRISHGLSIPEFRNPESDESGIDLAGSLQAIRTALVDAQLPFSIEESAHLSLLQFSTLQLWQDVSENWETFPRNPVVRHLVKTPTDSFVDPAADTPVASDAEARAYCPIPIDGSQLRAVSWAEAGRSFVLEGPPGTGKSQTITNLISNALAAGKTVLFVAEKQAALDVVRRRLDAVGVGDLCLDLHGKEQTPENMRAQLRAALHLQATSNTESWAVMRARHQTTVDNLGRYPAALHEPGGAGLSAWTARQSLLSGGDGPEVEIPSHVVSRPLDTDSVYRVVRELSQALYDLGASLEIHPWRLAGITNLEDPDVRGRLSKAVAALAAADAALADGPIVDLLDSCKSIEALGIVATWLATIAAAGWSPDASAVEMASRVGWRAHLTAARASLAAVRTDASSLLRTFEPEVISTADLDGLLTRAKGADGKLFKGKARKAVAAELASMVRPDGSLDPDTITPTVEALLALRSNATDVTRQIEGVAGMVLPGGWSPLATDAAEKLDLQVAAIESSVTLVEHFPAVIDVLRRTPAGTFLETPAPELEGLRTAWDELTSLLGCSTEAIAAWCGPNRPLLAAIRAALPTWTADAGPGGLVQLGRWSRVQAHLTALIAAGLGDFAERISAATVAPDDMEPVLRRSFARAALVERLSSTVLAGFDGVIRDRAIERFASGADELRRDMVAELPAKIVAERSFSADRLVGKVGELSRELSRKRGGQKIRELFTNYGPIIAELTPCLMMSPHSVARFLPPDALEIDLVVFDEASQIKVAQAIGAMGRAKSTVVVGDSQQMPPSNLAAVGSATEDEDESSTGIPSDMESVLSEAVESNLPRLWLSWHYRSQHESLISFSNHKYYEGRLTTFPRPPATRSDLGVSCRRVNGTFERGGERVNRVEAAAIVEEICSRLARHPNASIGVVTFNTQQRDLIMDLLEESSDPRVGAALGADQDALFVKNLENVQGDERDVILFSLAFSPNPETGKLPLNFGPLLQAGGERRLNVAVTRARAEVVVFSSFDPGDIDLSRSSSIGLAHLRSYMEMAQRRADDPGVLRPLTARDLHQDDVVAALENVGLHVRKNVGISDFTVDLGVAANPDGPWVAVFLDGPAYAKRATVGDRESLPYGVLVGSMGWARVERVWSPDWGRDRSEVIERIIRAVQKPTVTVETAAMIADPPLEIRPAPAIEPELVPAPAAAGSNGRADRDTTDSQERVALIASESPPAPTEHPAFFPAHERLVGTREMLDGLAFDASARRAVHAELQEAIANESPIAASRLARIVGHRFGLQRVAAKRVADIVGLVPSSQIDRTLFGSFAWADGQDRTDYREFRVASDDRPRVLDEIAPQELVNAMSYLARVGVGIAREELLRETALLFGVRRIATRVRTHLEAVLDYGIEQALLSDDGTAITAIGA